VRLIVHLVRLVEVAAELPCDASAAPAKVRVWTKPRDATGLCFGSAQEAYGPPVKNPVLGNCESVIQAPTVAFSSD
jgi:hypothetical protein